MTPATAKDIGSTCLGLHVRRAARRITRLYDLALAPVDLTIGQFSVLAMLAAQESWAVQPLADALGTDRSSLTASLKPLERRGLVVSSPDGHDRRLRFLNLSPLGAGLIDEAHALWANAQQKIESLLGSESAVALRSALSVLQ
ncbi:MAG: MarR family winged helix-turn-helix transcriptional regulator [Sphingomonas sp.]|nr:MarR family winged helix-turn-helix transcriptional regulator [Sphingomonas sp.]